MESVVRSVLDGLAAMDAAAAAAATPEAAAAGSSSSSAAAAAALLPPPTAPLPPEALAAVAEGVATIKRAMYGTPDAPPDKAAARVAAHELLRTDALAALVYRLAALPFEARKDTHHIFAHVLRKHAAPVPAAATPASAEPPPVDVGDGSTNE